MKAALALFLVMIIGLVALIEFQSSAPSAYIVQPSSDRVLGYCPVENAGTPCYIGGREGECVCQTYDKYRPLYSQRDNCQCLIPLYIKGNTW